MVDQYLLDEYFPDEEESKIFLINAHYYYLKHIAMKQSCELPQICKKFVDNLDKKSHIEVVRLIRDFYTICTKNPHHPGIDEHAFVEFYNLFADNKRYFVLCENCGVTSLSKRQ
eukprot:Pompholyxophrys_punicea_v1_NODE_337_length_2211_cov_21.567718.p3 type:complete len:114 gc:universal NODE_337_length_2211_cov_21.567718:1364-1705(+)